MTAHSAKGLEFNSVYIVGMEEDLFPSQMAKGTMSELEEERRLFYVAVTRAERDVTISYATSRFRWGQLISCTPSRFIKDIDEQYLEMPAESHFERDTDDNDSYPDFSKPLFKKKQQKKPEKTITGNSMNNKKLVNVNSQRIKSAKVEFSSFEADDPVKIQTGMEVEHARFGKGKVLVIEGEMPNKKATVFFQNYGQKQLLLKFAKLKIIK
jgi:DNA helicase-2/ATP-dependent DNA helicase PcrA